MRRIALALSLALPLPAGADCASDIAALFAGGPLDPFARPNRRETTTAHHPDGSTTPVSDVLWDGVSRSINCYGSGCAMAIGASAWRGPSFDGPWTYLGDTLPADPEDFTRAMTTSLAANITEPACPGVVEIGSRTATRYDYRTRTDPNEYGSWFGGRYSAYVDVESGRLIRLELAGQIASWAPDPSPDLQVTEVVYDETISIVRPAE